MEFDKQKVYTALNADDINVGSRGYFADTLENLKDVVKYECSEYYGKVVEINKESYEDRFRLEDKYDYCLFFLVEEPKEKRLRPYRDTDEMIEDFKSRYNSYGGWSGKSNPMYIPLIWVRNACGKKRLVTNIDDDSVYLQGWVSLPEFAEAYTYLDGSPCGIEE